MTGPRRPEPNRSPGIQSWLLPVVIIAALALLRAVQQDWIGAGAVVVVGGIAGALVASRQRPGGTRP